MAAMTSFPPLEVSNCLRLQISLEVTVSETLGVSSVLGDVVEGREETCWFMLSAKLYVRKTWNHRQKKKNKNQANKQTNQKTLRQDGSLGEPDLTVLCDMNIAPSDLLWENGSSSKSAIFTARETFQTQRSVLNADLLTSGHHHPYIKCSFMFPCWWWATLIPE